MNDNQNENNLVVEKEEEVVSTSVENNAATEQKEEVTSTPTVDNSNEKQVQPKKGGGCFSIFIIITVIFIVITVGFFWFMWPAIKSSINMQWDKPIIYLYPEEDSNISIKVDHPEKFNVTYPKYKDGWNVLAKTDGTLIDKNGRKYYSLYWEGNMSSNDMKSDGFIVKGKDVSEFLEDKLTILGLNYKEREEFIIYWLPQLENNKYNYIRFKTMDEINDNMKLIIDPKPDTLIRVMMEFKSLDKNINIKPQSLKKVSRSGYTVVEWGGTKIN